MYIHTYIYIYILLGLYGDFRAVFCATVRVSELISILLQLSPYTPAKPFIKCKVPRAPQQGQHHDHRKRGLSKRNTIKRSTSNLRWLLQGLSASTPGSILCRVQYLGVSGWLKEALFPALMASSILMFTVLRSAHRLSRTMINRSD